jgi:hypothetical protein
MREKWNSTQDEEFQVNVHEHQIDAYNADFITSQVNLNSQVDSYPVDNAETESQWNYSTQDEEQGVNVQELAN